MTRRIAQNRPFFISANTHDPHRPYAGAPGERESLERRFKQETRKLDVKPEFILPPEVVAYSGKNIEAPGFIPDHEMVREEFGYYLNSSYRADQFVGALMQVLEDRDLLDDTLVIFHSDNGMHWPYAKSNVYVASVKTPFVIYLARALGRRHIIRQPGFHYRYPADNSRCQRDRSTCWSAGQVFAAVVK